MRTKQERADRNAGNCSASFGAAKPRAQQMSPVSSDDFAAPQLLVF
jgi:hypothetical protein